MALRYYANAPATDLASGCTAVATTIEVSSVAGLPTSYPYTLIIDRGLSTEEAVEVTNASSTTLTVTRGVDSTTAFAHSLSAEVVHGITARDLREPNAHIEATVAHGATGAVVGTTNTQTLTNKTLTSPVLNGELSGTAVDWQAWTPSWTNVTVGNGTLVARYRTVGKTVDFRLSLLAGTTTSSLAVPMTTLPVEPLYGHPLSFHGDIRIGGSDQRPGRINVTDSGCYIEFLTFDGLWANPAVSLAVNEYFHFTGTYEIA